MAARPYQKRGARDGGLTRCGIEVLCATRAQQQRQRGCGGMRGGRWAGVSRPGVSEPGWAGMGCSCAIDPGGADEHARLTFESIGEVDDAGSGAGGALPVPEGELLVAGKEGEVHAIEGVGIDALDEADLIADGFKAAQLGFVIHELEIGVGKGESASASLSSLPRSDPAPTMAIFGWSVMRWDPEKKAAGCGPVDGAGATNTRGARLRRKNI